METRTGRHAPSSLRWLKGLGMMQLPVGRTVWNITVGTYGSRLHGADEPTVDREHNRRGEAFVAADPMRERMERRAMRGPEVRLSREQRELIEEELPGICGRGGWGFVICAAPGPPDDDHFHVLLAVAPEVHGKRVRLWLKRWLTEALDERFGRPVGGEWWVDGGSTKPVKDDAYYTNVFGYIRRQRTTRWEGEGG